MQVPRGAQAEDALPASVGLLSPPISIEERLRPVPCNGTRGKACKGLRAAGEEAAACAAERQRCACCCYAWPRS